MDVSSGGRRPRLAQGKPLVEVVDPAYGKLLEAVAFAARAHQGQLRKDGRTPYVSHVFRACLTLRHVFGIDDVPTLTAAILHDTVEDTTTDYDDLAQRFGPQIAGWVALLSKDKRQEEGRREEEYKRRLATADWQVKACKLADAFDNLVDSANIAAKGHKVLQRSREYLQALEAPDLPGPVRRAWDTVSRLLAEMERKSAGRGRG
jgi:guanosine-3',5'-bis(diphosphate) 3'-pyrophosphohydrolase